jgi:hypothetical protein
MGGVPSALESINNTNYYRDQTLNRGKEIIRNHVKESINIKTRLGLSCVEISYNDLCKPIINNYNQSLPWYVKKSEIDPKATIPCGTIGMASSQLIRTDAPTPTTVQKYMIDEYLIETLVSELRNIGYNVKANDTSVDIMWGASHT